ncbi:hypothetical protein LNT54_11975 [Klebsiella pneumoniae]|nr:hypothetical protein [Klebsiella pneumoniae]
MPVNDEHASKKYYQRQGKGNHSQPAPAIAGAAQKANQAEDEADSIRATDLVAMEW